MSSELKNRVLEKKLLLIDFLIFFFRGNRVYYFIQLYIQCIYKFKGLNIEYYLSCRFCLSIMVLLSCNFIIMLYHYFRVTIHLIR